MHLAVVLRHHAQSLVGNLFWHHHLDDFVLLDLATLMLLFKVNHLIMLLRSLHLQHLLLLRHRLALRLAMLAH